MKLQGPLTAWGCHVWSLCGYWRTIQGILWGLWVQLQVTFRSHESLSTTSWVQVSKTALFILKLQKPLCANSKKQGFYRGATSLAGTFRQLLQFELMGFSFHMKAAKKQVLGVTARAAKISSMLNTRNVGPCLVCTPPKQF